MSHGDAITNLSRDFEIIASTDACEAAAVANDKQLIYGVQFHPEVAHTLKESRYSKISCSIYAKPKRTLISQI